MVRIPPLAAINVRTGSKRAPDLQLHMTSSALVIELQYLVLPQMFRNFLRHATLKGNVPGPMDCFGADRACNQHAGACYTFEDATI